MSGGELGFLGALGYTVFEYRDGVFYACGESPGWLRSLLCGEGREGSLLAAFPFLEVFLLDAEVFWTNPEDRTALQSDYWTQADLTGNDLCLRATAFRLNAVESPPRKLLAIESVEHGFEEKRLLVQYSHETSLAYDKIAKLSRELERATAAKSEFLARMSHEVRTPLNALLGMAELLIETPLTTEQREMVRIFQRAGDDLVNVVNDVLDFSKVEAGQLELENIAFDLAEVLEKALEVVAFRAHKKGLELSGRIQSGVPEHLVGDPGRLRQVLLNLLMNAVKFTDRGDVTVLVRASLNDPASGSLHFTVCDTGIGIPADRLSSIFDSFTQASAATARTFGGTGLGLAISKRFVELMGGTIWAESTLGTGTRMHFTAHFDVDIVEVACSTKGTGLRCLLVDDNANHRAMIAAILTGWGAEVVESDGPASARESTGKTMPPYDLVLVDAQMQTSDDGLDLAARIKEEQLASKVVVMLTTDRLADATHCRDLGLAYLLKPVRRSELREAISGRNNHETAPAGQPPGLEREGSKIPGTRRLRILLADDSEDNRFLVRGYLKDCGHTIDEVENGSLAVERFRHEAYDLVITDVEMPVLDGFSAAREMRAVEKQLGRVPTPILAVTAHALKEATERAIDAGCTDHIPKPIRKATLLEAIQRCAGQTLAAGRVEVSVEPWLKPIVAIYLEKRRSDLATLRSAIEAWDYSAIRMIGHQMAGTGASYGFAPISEVGFALEEAALSRQSARIVVIVEELDRYLRNLQAP